MSERNDSLDDSQVIAQFVYNLPFVNLRESSKSADAFRVQPAVLAHRRGRSRQVAAGPWLKNFSGLSEMAVAESKP
jgi:hypothetical protein